MRILKHLLMPDWLACALFSPRHLGRSKAPSAPPSGSTTAIAVRHRAGSHGHTCTETRRRAEALFAELGVWDTENNSGVLVYVELVDRRIEIVADRGIAATVPQPEWEAICRRMQDAFSRQQFLPGSLEGIHNITAILGKHFPPRGRNPNELPDKPVTL